MQCPQCQQVSVDDAAYCGNCGAPLTIGSAEQASLDSTVAVAIPAEATMIKSVGDHSGKAIIAFVVGVVGLVAWLVPIAGLVAGLVAMVCGTIAFHSRRRAFARSGIALSALVLSASLFMWVHSAQRLSSTASANAPSSTNSAADGSLQAVVTSCYTTKVPRAMNITGNSATCTFRATNPVSGEQLGVKVLNIPNLTSTTLTDIATSDTATVLRAISGGRVTNQQSALFVGSATYQIDVVATDGSGGTIDYIYDQTPQGNLVIVTHSQVHVSGDNTGRSLIEANWSWI